MKCLYDVKFVGTNYRTAAIAAQALLDWFEYAGNDDGDWELIKIAGWYKIRRSDGFYLHDDGQPTA